MSQSLKQYKISSKRRFFRNRKSRQLKAYIDHYEVIDKVPSRQVNYNDLNISRIIRLTYQFDLETDVAPSPGASDTDKERWLHRHSHIEGAAATAERDRLEAGLPDNPKKTTPSKTP